MKKQTTSIAIASIFAITALFAAAATHLDERELGIGEFNEQANFNHRASMKRELGIGEYREVAYNNAPRLDERELGSGEFNEQA